MSFIPEYASGRSLEDIVLRYLEWVPEVKVEATVDGLVTLFGVVYSDAITFAATGAFNPVLLIPVMATGFAVGCGVGATVSPAFLWIGRIVGGG